MSLPVCSVTCTMHGQDGEPEPGASFEFRLNRYEVYEGFVVPEIMRGVADETGSCVLDLWPNQLGTTESVYDVTMRSTTGKTQRITASVPSETTANLHDIAMLPPYPGKPDFQTQMDAAIEAKQSAVAAMDTTLEARDVTLAARDAAQSSEDDATAQAVIATAQAVIATTKAAEAAASAVTAATFDPALFVPKAGGVTMTGTLAVPAGATGSNVPRASEVVPNTGDTTIAGIKTFSASPVVPAGATGSQAPRRSEVVGSTGNETIAGIKTFSSAPVVPASATGSQAVRAEETIRNVGGAARIPSWTTAGRPGSPAAGDTGFNTTLGCREMWDGAEWVAEGWVRSPSVSLNGLSSQVLSGIPAYANEVVLHIVELSTTSNINTRVRLNSAASAYRSSASILAPSAAIVGGGVDDGFLIYGNAAAASVGGCIVFRRAHGTVWSGQGVMSNDEAGTMLCGGTFDVGGALTSIDLVLPSTAWDAGSVSLSWRK